MDSVDKITILLTDSGGYAKYMEEEMGNVQPTVPDYNYRISSASNSRPTVTKPTV